MEERYFCLTYYSSLHKCLKIGLVIRIRYFCIFSLVFPIELHRLSDSSDFVCERFVGYNTSVESV